MKKLLSLLAGITVLLCLACAACGEKTDIPAIGLSMELPTEDANLLLQSAAYNDRQTGVEIYFYNHAAIDPYLTAWREAQSGTAEEADAARKAYEEQLNMHYQWFGSVLGYRTDILSQVTAEMLEGAVPLGANNAYTYYLYSGRENDLLAEEDRPLMEAARGQALRILDSVTVINCASANTTLDTSALGAFSTTDLAGNPVDTNVFTRADLTVLHVWGTFCSPCINEMPNLAAWARELPENVQLIGLLSDVGSMSDKTFATAQKILERSGADFVNLIANQSLRPFLNGVSAVPTTFLIDRNGNLVGEPIVGAYIEKYKQAVAAYLAR